MNDKRSYVNSIAPREQDTLDWSAVEEAYRRARRLRAEAFGAAAVKAWRWIRARVAHPRTPIEIKSVESCA